MAAPNPDLGATTQSKLVDHAPNPEDLKEDVGRENLEAIGDLAGPAVRLYYFDPVHYIWYGSVLVACHTKLFGQQAPLLNYKTSETDPTDVVGEIILNHAEWSVVRFRLRAVLEPTRSTLEYSIRFAASEKSPKGVVNLPACTETWHVTAFSCNDQRQREKTGTAAWAAMRILHERNPLHAVIGLGDQLYNDNVWHIPAMKQWLAIPDKEQMRATELTPVQEAAAEEFYFFAYVRWLALHPLRQHLASIPMLNTWDDHEIFDGWGSYPPHLQNCKAFASVFKLAKRMYAAFQLHTTVKTQKSDGYFTAQGDSGLSWMSQLGPKLAVAAIDTRSSRTRERIIPEKLMDSMLERVRNLPATVKHLLFVSAVPVQYTEMQFMEKLVATGEGNGFLKKTGLMNQIMNEFGEPELLDDLLDHWSSSRHVTEKGLLLHELRKLAAERDLRITMLSGSVNLAAYGFTSSTEKYNALASDPGFMPQIITSAVAFNPIGWSQLAALDKASGYDTHVVYPHEPKLYGGMGQLFKHKKASGSVRFANRNNFLEIEVRESRVFTGIEMLKCTYHVRSSTDPKDEPDLEQYVIELPPVVPKNTDPTMIAKLQEQIEHTLPGRGTIMRKVPCCGGCFAMCGL